MEGVGDLGKLRCWSRSYRAAAATPALRAGRAARDSIMVRERAIEMEWRWQTAGGCQELAGRSMGSCGSQSCFARPGALVPDRAGGHSARLRLNQRTAVNYGVLGPQSAKIAAEVEPVHPFTGTAGGTLPLRKHPSQNHSTAQVSDVKFAFLEDSVPASLPRCRCVGEKRVFSEENYRDKRALGKRLCMRTSARFESSLHLNTRSPRAFSPRTLSPLPSPSHPSCPPTPCVAFSASRAPASPSHHLHYTLPLSPSVPRQIQPGTIALFFITSVARGRLPSQCLPQRTTPLSSKPNRMEVSSRSHKRIHCFTLCFSSTYNLPCARLPLYHLRICNITLIAPNSV
jgi:hypothetical protein